MIFAADGAVKVGADDFLAAGHGAADVFALARPADTDPPPAPLSRRVRLPPFPADEFPPAIAGVIDAVATFTQTDAGMAGTTALAVLAAVAGGRVEVEVRPGWREPLCLYTVTAAVPGERKSAVQAVMTRPIVDVEAELARAGAAARLEAETAKNVATRAAEQARQAAGRAEGSDRDRLLADAVAASSYAEAIKIPPVPRLLADDVTPEAAASVLAEQRGRLAIVSAEGGIFYTIAGRYSGQVPNLDVWLKGHAGDPLRVDRKGRPPEFVPRPALTLALMIQPGVLATVARSEALRSRGLLARFLYALPPSKVGYRQIAPPPIPNAVRSVYAAMVQHLARGLADWTDPAVLTLTPGAHALLVEAERDLEPRLGPTGSLAHIADWGAKLAGAVVRIAALLHLAADPVVAWRTSIDEASVASALRLGDYYQAHALAAFDAMNADPASDDARQLLAVIRRLGRELVTKRDLFSAASRTRFRKTGDLDPALRLLEDHGYLTRLPEPNRDRRGRPTSPTWAVHVAALSAQPAETPVPSVCADYADSAARDGTAAGAA